MAVAGTGIPSGSTVISVGTTSITISKNTTAANTGVQLTIVNQPSAFDTELTRMINSASRTICRA